MKKVVIFLLGCLSVITATAQIPESESNNTFATANVIQVFNNIIASTSNGSDNDYFRTILPADGTIKIYIQATNASANSGFLHIHTYHRNFSQLTSEYVGTSSTAAGATIFDSVTIRGQAADTFYIRFTCSQTFNYQFNYSILDQSANDAEPNNSFATASPMVMGQTQPGHTNYEANNGTLDPSDYFRTILPVDGTLKVYIKATNMAATTSYLTVSGYDRRQAGNSFSDYVTGTYVAAGSTAYDTITLQGLAADTFYFRFIATHPFAYEFRYELVDQSPNDIEPNNSFATASPIAMGQTKSGHTNYNANGSTYDLTDYYRTIFPVDGTLKVYIKATNRDALSGYLTASGYDRRQAGNTYSIFLTGTSIQPGVTAYDTITVYGLAADTFYFRFNATRAFEYDIRYEMADQSPNDTEPNNSFTTAAPIAMGETKPGHSNYEANGGTYDPDDYYRTIFPVDGTLKVYIKATNRSPAFEHISMNGYDRRKSSSTTFGGFIATFVPAGTTIYDTITVHSQAADTFYFRLFSTGACAYEYRYEMTDTSLNDVEPNNTFAEATLLNGSEVKWGHTGYNFNGTFDAFDYYKTIFTTTDSLKLYLEATNYSGATNTFTLTGYNTAQSQIYSRTKSGVPHGATVYDSVKILVTGPQTIYNRTGSTNDGFSYQLTLNTKLPGNGFAINGPLFACNIPTVYKALNITEPGLVYHWTLSSGGTLSFTDSIATVTWTTPGTHTLQLYLSNAFGNSLTKQIIVTVNDLTPTITPVVTVKGRYLDIPSLPAGTTRRWFKDAVFAGNTDSVYYAATAGSYTAKYANNCGDGPASPAIVFNAPQSQTISFPAVSNIGYSADSFRVLAATATSGLPATYKIISGPGVLHNDSLFVTAAGTIVVQALQFGNIDYGAATPVNISVTVVNGPQVITFNPIPNKILSIEDFALDAYASSELPVTYSIVSGPATIAGSRVKMTGVGTVQVKAMQAGNANYLPAPEVIRSFCIGIRQIDTIKGVVVSCPTTLRYTTKKITGALYEWSVSGGGILTPAGDTAIVQWQTPGTHTVIVKAYSACDPVRSDSQTRSVTVLGSYQTGSVTGLTPVDNATGLSLPLTLQWSPVTNATSYDIYVWPTGFAQPVLPLDSGLVQVTYDLNTNIALNIPYSWKVIARNVCTSSSSAIQQFIVVQNSDGKPDLIMDTISFQANIYQGQPLTVSWRVKNIGTNSTGAATWKDRIYLSPTNDLRRGTAVLLGGYNNPSYLLPGETYTQTKTVTVPPGFAGTWHLFVITDNEEAFCFDSYCNVFWSPWRYCHGENDVRERIETNNYRYEAIPISDGPLPDLQVKSVAVPGATFGGSTITVTYKVKNEGSTPASGKLSGSCPQRGWRDRFFISDQPIFNISNAYEFPDSVIRFFKPGTTNCANETIPYVDYLLPDSSYLAQHQILLPYNFFGKHYIYVYTNGYNDSYEGPFNTNNLRGSDSINITAVLPADLVVSNIQDLTGVLSGQLVNINFTVNNQGANAPYASEVNWTDSVFICSSASFSYANVIAKGRKNRPCPANFITGASYGGTCPIQIPNGISGTYYVFVKTDAANQVYEFTQELNNILQGNAFTIALSPPVDMIITSILAPDSVRAGVPFNMTYTVKNTGAGTVSASWADIFYAGTDSIPQLTGHSLVSIGHTSNDSLVANAQRTYTRQAVIKASDGFSGQRVFIKGKADGNDIIYEHFGEDNNIAVNISPVGTGSIYVKPPIEDTIDRRSNIEVVSVTAPASFNANSSITFSWTVRNKGPLATTKTYWQDRVYLSADSFVSNGDIELKRLSISQYTTTGLLPDSQYQRSASYQIPVQLSGNYFLIGITDCNQYITNDSTEDDNRYWLPVNIIAAPAPDLVIAPLNNPPDSVWGGSVFYLKYSVQNIGPVTAQAIWYDGVYVQPNSPPGGNSPFYKANNISLAPGASYTDSILVQVPIYISGNYQLMLYADRRNDVFEGAGGNTNNIHTRPITIYPFNSRPAPDLIISQVTVPDSVILGKSMAAGYTITNAGSHPANGNVSNAFYLSANAIYENSLDKLTGTEDLNNFILQPGQSVTGQLNGKALPPVAGLYHSILRTNSRNTLFEGTAVNNNIKASDSTTYIDAHLLTLGVAKADTLIPNDGNYYKVVVGDSLDLSVSLTTSYAGDGNNAVYVSRNRVPDETNYDASGFDPSAVDQEVLISSTQAGTYYIKAQSFGIYVNEPVSLLVTAIPFSIINVTPAVMGKGTVSGMLYGGGFKPNTQILLRKNATSYNVGSIQQFINSTKLKMLWNLGAVPVGVYDVVAVNPGNIETVLANAVTIEVAREYQLEYTPQLPAEVRPFAGVFTYKGKNIGNVNIDVVQGDITMIEKNATVKSVSTTGRIHRYTKYASQFDSLMTEDWYISGKNRVVPFIGRNIAPGEEFSITIETRFKGTNVITEQKNVLPLQCRMFGYSSADFARTQIRNMEILRLFFANDPRGNQIVNNPVIRDSRTGSRVFIENMMNEYVIAGLMSWTDTIGLNLRWDCSRCLQNLQEFRIPYPVDTFVFNPAGAKMIGTDSLGTGQVFGKNQKFLLEMNKSRFWGYYDGQPGQAGEEDGWDMLKIQGTLFIAATPAERFKIFPTSLAKYPGTTENRPSQLPGWSPAYDTSFLIVVASGGIGGYDSAKFFIDYTNFASLNDLRRGHFTTELRQGFGFGDSILLVWKAYKPTWGEAGVDGADGAPGHPGSPGGKGGPGNAQNQKGGKGGKGGRGSDEIYTITPPQKGGRGGEGGDGYGPGGDGGDAGKTGNAMSLMCPAGERGGNGSNAGSHGGRGGNGGKGATGCNGGLQQNGSDGGDGGNGGTGVNSSHGGNGGNGGEGGKGGSDCGGGRAGGDGGKGGTKGAGPLGLGNDGASGRKGITGTNLVCPPCSSISPSPPYAKIAANSMIDYGKASYGVASGLADGDPLSVRNAAIEILNQSSNEYNPGANTALTLADAAFDLVAVGALLEYKAVMKAAIAALKAGDYLASTQDPNYKTPPLIKNLITGLTFIASPEDFVVSAIKAVMDFGDMVSALIMVQPCDPNDITGPAGYDEERFISRNMLMPFMIRFENDSLAQVPAQRVVVRQPISLKADPLTFKLGNFNFGGHTFEVPANRSNYFTVLNLDSLGYRVEVTAGIDIISREVFWILQTIDPETGAPPSNAFSGFLPANDSTEKGTGFVSYTIKPLVTDITGDSITAKAAIVFDVNEPIETNTWLNTVDAFPPVSTISNLPDQTPDTEINVHYTGIDDLGGSGLKTFRLYVSDNGAPQVLLNFSGTDTALLGEVGHTYRFYGEAIDNVGNIETLLYLDSVKIIAGQEIICPGSHISFDSKMDGASYQWQIDNGTGYSNISNGGIYSGATSSILSLVSPSTSMYGYKFRCLVNGTTFSEMFLLKFGMTWEGTVSTAWENPANWSCNSLPDMNTDVVVNGGKTNYPNVSSNVTVRTLRLNPGASGTVNTGFTLTIMK